MGDSIIKKSTGLAALKKAISDDQRVAMGELSRAGKQESLVICIDCSGSMMDAVDRNRGQLTLKIQVAIDAATALVKACGAMSSVGAVPFSDVAHEQIPIGTIGPELEAAIRGFIRWSGGTMFYTALEASASMIAAAGERRVKRVILMSDGQDYPDGRAQLESWVKIYIDRKIIIDTVAFGTDADRGLLEWIAKQTGGVMKEARDAASLVKAFLALEAGTRGLLGAGKK